MKHRISAILLLSLVFSIWSCYHNSGGHHLSGAYIHVWVLDNDAQTPLPGVEVTLGPVNIVKTTDENGECLFSVDPGDYVINASVCCIGPGFLEYHDSVAVSYMETIMDTLLGCSMCL